MEVDECIDDVEAIEAIQRIINDKRCDDGNKSINKEDNINSSPNNAINNNDIQHKKIKTSTESHPKQKIHKIIKKIDTPMRLGSYTSTIQSGNKLYDIYRDRIQNNILIERYRH